MNDYDNYPPLELFKKTLKTEPKSASIYVALWKLNPNTNHLSIPKEDVKKIFLISPTLFRNHLLSLSRIDLISFEETTEFFLVDFYE